jgi:hypothetical protein
MNRAEKTGIAVAVVGLLVAVLAWQFPRPPTGGDSTVAGPPPPPPASSPTTPPGPGSPTPDPAATYLDSLTPVAGAANLAPLPDALRGRPGYDHPVVLRCPTNESDARAREVTYPLRGRYRDFSATVRPYFASDTEAKTYVFAIARYRERDDTFTEIQAGAQFTASMTRPGPLAAGVAARLGTTAGADELTVRVRCEVPDGVVVLAGAALRRNTG